MAGLGEFETQARAHLRLPADAHVIGEPVTVTALRSPGRPHVGLLATCQRGENSYEVGLVDVKFAAGSPARQLVSRYRAWLGLPVASAQTAAAPRPHKVASEDIVVGKPVDLVVLACKSNAIRRRLLGTSREVTLRTAVRDEVPGSIITVTPTREWTHARHPYISGSISSTRCDALALGLTPLALHQQGDWDPNDEYWGEEGEPIEDWAKPIIARGKRPMFELEQVIPGADPEDFDSALARTNGCPDLDEIDHCAAELERAIDGHRAQEAQIDAQYDEHDDGQLSVDDLDDELIARRRDLSGLRRYDGHRDRRPRAGRSGHHASGTRPPRS